MKLKPSNKTFAFPKKDRLTGKKTIEGLFKSGSSFYFYPFIVRFDEGSECHRVLITVSKKHFKRATDRNTVKRRVREAYRRRRHDIAGPALNIALIYSAEVILPFREIDSKLSNLLKRLENLRAQKNSKS